VVEFALDSVHNLIGVSTYKLRNELPSDLQDCLPTVEQLEMELEALSRNWRRSRINLGRIVLVYSKLAVHYACVSLM